MPYNAILHSADEWRAKNRMSALPPFFKRQSQAETPKRPRPVSEFMYYPVEIHSVEDFETVSPLIGSSPKPWDEDDFVPYKNKENVRNDATANPAEPVAKRDSIAAAYDNLTANDPANKRHSAMPADGCTETEIPGVAQKRRRDSLLSTRDRAETYDNLSPSKRASKRRSLYEAYDNLTSSDRASKRRSFAPTENYHASQSPDPSTRMSQYPREPILARNWKPQTTCEPRAQDYDNIAAPKPTPEVETPAKKKSWRSKAGKGLKKLFKIASGSAEKTAGNAVDKPALPEHPMVAPPPPQQQQQHQGTHYPSQHAGRAFVELRDQEDRPDSGVEMADDQLSALPQIKPKRSMAAIGSSEKQRPNRKARHSTIF